jgi:hypothetical protein
MKTKEVFKRDGLIIELTEYEVEQLKDGIAELYKNRHSALFSWPNATVAKLAYNLTDHINKK